MSKVGRNSPCPCGSGKKYKKCCGKQAAVSVPIHLEQQLEAVKHDLFAFAKEDYKLELDAVLERDLQAYIGESNQENYAALVYPWYVFSEPVNEQEETVYDIFAKDALTKITNERVKKAFLSWKNILSSIYEIVAVPKKNTIVVQDITSEQTYQVILPNIDVSSKGKFIMGTLVPYISTNQFFHVTALFPKEAKESIMEVMAEFNNDASYVHKVFPEFIAHFYGGRTENQTVAWQDEIYEEIADELLERFEAKQRKDEAINYILSFWHYYSTKHRPRVTKKATYFAALDYLASKLFATEDTVTQAMVAKEYAVSAGTISNHYKKMMAETTAFEEEIG